MSNELINVDFSQRVVIQTNDLPWIPSPQAGVERRPLDRIGGEVARATSLVRYMAGCTFPAHVHELGEEFLVIEGVFSDESVDFPAGAYVRNPPGSRHSPHTKTGCVILVKLRQMSSQDQRRIVIDTASLNWRRDDSGREAALLYQSGPGKERVTMERLDRDADPNWSDCPGGEEIFVLSGMLSDEHGDYPEKTWIRNPDGFQRTLNVREPTIYWSKRGHLPRTQ